VSDDRKVKPLPAVWQDVVLDCALGKTTNLAALTLSTWMDGKGGCFPSRETIAARAGLSVRAVDGALAGLEQAGLLQIEHSRGRRRNVYCATLPEWASELRRWQWDRATAQRVRGSGKATAQPTPSTAQNTPFNSAPPAPESLESHESGALDAAARLRRAAAGALPEDDCTECGQRRGLVEGLVCVPCAAKMVAAEIADDLRQELGQARAEIAGKDGRA
jgi:hypothetical protein